MPLPQRIVGGDVTGRGKPPDASATPLLSVRSLEGDIAQKTAEREAYGYPSGMVRQGIDGLIDG